MMKNPLTFFSFSFWMQSCPCKANISVPLFPAAVQSFLSASFHNPAAASGFCPWGCEKIPWCSFFVFPFGFRFDPFPKLSPCVQIHTPQHDPVIQRISPSVSPSHGGSADGVAHMIQYMTQKQFHHGFLYLCFNCRYFSSSFFCLLPFCLLNTTNKLLASFFQSLRSRSNCRNLLTINLAVGHSSLSFWFDPSFCGSVCFWSWFMSGY